MIKSTKNSSTTPLSAAATFTGPFEYVSHYKSIYVNCESDQQCSAYVDLSLDGVTVDKTYVLFDGLIPNERLDMLSLNMLYCRVRLVNGGVNQTTLKLRTYYSNNSQTSQIVNLVDSVDDYSNSLLGRNVIVGKNNAGNYSNLQIDNGKLDINLPLTSFGDLSVLSETALFHNSHFLGIAADNRNYIKFITPGGSLSPDSDGVAVNLDIDTTVGAYVVIRSERVLSYLHGTTLISRTGVLFDTPTVNSLQFTGLGTAGSDFYFCYDTTGQFGVRCSTGGFLNIHSFEVTLAENTGATATVTLNNVPYNVTLSNAGGDSDFTAHELEVGSTYGGLWNVEHVDNKVYFIASNVADLSGGTYSYSSTGVSTATLTQLNAGTPLVTTFIAQADWSEESEMKSIINPLNINLYQIQYSWFGTSNVVFSVYNPNLGRFEDVHKVKFANTGTTYSVTTPNMFIQTGLASLGSTTAMRMKESGQHGTSLGNRNVRSKNRISKSVTKSISGGTEKVMINVRNLTQLNGYPNQSEVLLSDISVATDPTGNKPTIIKILKEPTTISADTTSDFTNYIQNNINDITVFCTDSQTYTGGDIVDQFVLSVDASVTKEYFKKDIYLSSGENLLITAQSTNNNSISVTCNFIEIK